MASTNLVKPFYDLFMHDGLSACIAVSLQENSEETLGGWKTQSQLELQPGWDECGAELSYFRLIDMFVHLLLI